MQTIVHEMCSVHCEAMMRVGKGTGALGWRATDSGLNLCLAFVSVPRFRSCVFLQSDSGLPRVPASSEGNRCGVGVLALLASSFFLPVNTCQLHARICCQHNALTEACVRPNARELTLKVSHGYSADQYGASGGQTAGRCSGRQCTRPRSSLICQPDHHQVPVEATGGRLGA